MASYLQEVVVKMHVSTNGLMVFGLIIIVTVSLFLGALGINTATGSIDTSTILTSPSAWEIVTFTASAFGSLMLFRIPDLGVISVFFWIIGFIELWCITKLIRGTD